MTYLKKFAATSLILSALTACAGMGVGSETKATMKSIAVTSVLGNKFYGTRTGITIFTNKAYEADVSDWSIDATTVQTALSIIRQNRSLEANSIGVSFHPEDVGAMLAAARKIGADTLVVVMPTAYANQPDFKGGVGYQLKSQLGMRECIYSLFVLEIYDVLSGKKVAWQWGFPMTVLNPFIPCYGQDKNIPWKEDFSLYDAREKAGLHDAIVQSIETNLSASLKGVGIAPQ